MSAKCSAKPKKTTENWHTGFHALHGERSHQFRFFYASTPLGFQVRSPTARMGRTDRRAGPVMRPIIEQPRDNGLTTLLTQYTVTYPVQMFLNSGY